MIVISKCKHSMPNIPIIGEPVELAAVHLIILLLVAGQHQPKPGKAAFNHPHQVRQAAANQQRFLPLRAGGKRYQAVPYCASRANQASGRIIQKHLI